MNAELGLEVRSVLQRLSALHQLERALEGKYVDFRVSTALEAMNFVFDRGGKTLYKAVVGHSRVAGVGDELTIYFSQLRLEGRDKYRVVLIGEQGATFEKGTRIPVEISINEGSGFRRAPVRMQSDVANREQRNFEFDFDAPEIPTITDLKISVPAHLPIRTAMLFMRHRFFKSEQQESLRSIEPRPVDEPPVSEPSGPRPDPSRPDYPEEGRRRGRLESTMKPSPDPPLERERGPAPWENSPQRRRRLDRE